MKKKLAWIAMAAFVVSVAATGVSTAEENVKMESTYVWAGGGAPSPERAASLVRGLARFVARLI